MIPIVPFMPSSSSYVAVTTLQSFMVFTGVSLPIYTCMPVPFSSVSVSCTSSLSSCFSSKVVISSLAR